MDKQRKDMPYYQLKGLDRRLNGFYRKGISTQKIAIYCQTTEEYVIERLKELGIFDTPWHGDGRTENIRGYINIYINGKWQPEHRYIWEQQYGSIPKGWIIHHINGIKSDNRIENLVALPRDKHRQIHMLHESEISRILELEERVRSLEDLVKGYEEILKNE